MKKKSKNKIIPKDKKKKEDIKTFTEKLQLANFMLAVKQAAEENDVKFIVMGQTENYMSFLGSTKTISEDYGMVTIMKHNIEQVLLSSPKKKS
jgi:hypothetical protein